VLLDGPYGGINMRRLDQCEQQLVIAGGSGAGWTLPIVSAFLRRLNLEDTNQPTEQSPTLKVVLASRDAATCAWFDEAVYELCKANGLGSFPSGLSIDMYHTGTEDNVAAPKMTGQFPQKLDEPEKAPDTHTALTPQFSDSDSSTSRSSTKHHKGRPDLNSLIQREAAGRTRRLGVFACGPLSMQSDVSNTVASEQIRVWKGDAKEIYLHMEHFSWA
jgi:predicted ferric reductase